LPEDNRDQRSKREGDQKFLRLQTEAQTIHGGTSRERKRGDELPLVLLLSRKNRFLDR
jgi:hypothetical protein